MIFVTVPSGSGAKYAAEEFTWWEAGGRGTTFSSDFRMSASVDPAFTREAECERMVVPTKAPNHQQHGMGLKSMSQP
jgi:hypothetical protein